MNRFNVRRVFLAFCMVFLFSVLSLCGCKRKEEVPDGPGKEKVPDVQYETGKVTAFCVDAQGQIYTCEDGTENICVYDAEGTKLREIAVEGGTGRGSRYPVLCTDKGVLYASDSVEFGIVEIDVSTGAKKLLYSSETPGYWDLADMVVCSGNLIFMYKKPVDYAEMQMLSDDVAGYGYGGETVVCLNPETKAANELEISGVKRLCKKSENEVLFFAYEPETGFAYRVYDAKKNLYSAEYEADQNLNLRWSAVMTYDAAIERLLYPASSGEGGQIRALDITKKESETDFYNTGQPYFGANSLQCVNGCTYFAADGKVTKIDNRSYLTITKNEPLKILCTSKYNFPAVGTGYEVMVEEADEDTIRTKLLAGDSDYDLLFLTSEHTLGEQIRRTGAFEPLNGADKMETYLNGCFDYIREAATTENGAIWMFPYEIDTRLLVYQPALCEKYRMDFTGNLTYSEYLEYCALLDSIASEDTPFFNSWLTWKTPLSQYILNYGLVNGEAHFDTEQFRTLALCLREMDLNFSRIFSQNERLQRIRVDYRCAETYDELREKVLRLFENYAFGDLDRHDLETKEGMTSIYDREVSFMAGLFDLDVFEARKLPSIAEGGDEKSVASATFYVINPNSKQKKEAMGYLAGIVENLLQNESIYRTKELMGEYSKMEKQVHEVYADAEIYFQYPTDVYGAEYLYYIKGQIDLEEMIREAERKFTIYLKE